MITQSDNEQLTEGYPQITIADTGWADEEQNIMRQHGYDSMDMLRVWEE